MAAASPSFPAVARAARRPTITTTSVRSVLVSQRAHEPLASVAAAGSSAGQDRGTHALPRFVPPPRRWFRAQTASSHAQYSTRSVCEPAAQPEPKLPPRNSSRTDLRSPQDKNRRPGPCLDKAGNAGRLIAAQRTSQPTTSTLCTLCDPRYNKHVRRYRRGVALWTFGGLAAGRARTLAAGAHSHRPHVTAMAHAVLAASIPTPDAVVRASCWLRLAPSPAGACACPPDLQPPRLTSESPTTARSAGPRLRVVLLLVSITAHSCTRIRNTTHGAVHAFLHRPRNAERTHVVFSDPVGVI